MNAHLHDAFERLAMGDGPSAEEQTHLGGCADCRARLALAVRVERLLVEWPVAAPAPDLASRVLAAARRDAWRREQVVDWSFNVAIGAGLAAVALGLAGVAWLLASAAGPGPSTEVMAGAAVDLIGRVRSQAAVTGTALLLLTTTLGAWWWAEGRKE